MPLQSLGPKVWTCGEQLKQLYTGSSERSTKRDVDLCHHNGRPRRTRALWRRYHQF